MIALLTVLFAGQVQADYLGTKASPYKVLSQATGAEKVELQAQLLKFIDYTDYSAEEKAAMYELMIEGTAQGDDLLERLPVEIVSWWYGQGEIEGDLEYRDLVQNAARVSRQDSGWLDQCKTWTLCVYVAKSAKKIFVFKNGQKVSGMYGEPIATARKGKVTPTGIFSVEELAGKNRRSGKYNGAYMGWAMQFMGDYFLHATDMIKSLGSAASAGCVRLHPNVAQPLNALMRDVGRKNIRVYITND